MTQAIKKHLMSCMSDVFLLLAYSGVSKHHSGNIRNVPCEVVLRWLLRKMSKIDDFRLKIESIIDLMFGFIGRIVMSEIDYEYETVVKAINFIDTRYKNKMDISVEEASEYTGYSIRQLNRIFIKIKGMSVAKYISLTKIDYAGKLIAMGVDVNIAADRSNISQSALLKGIKERTGLLPSDLKKDNSIKRGGNVGKVIAIGFSVGGAGTSTLSLIAGAILAQENRVLIIDGSPIASTSFVLMGETSNRQGSNELLDFELDSKKFSELAKFGVIGAMIEQNPQKYIINLSSNFHLLPNDGYLSYSFPRLLYLEKLIKENSFKHMIEKLKSDYDYIIIDTHYVGLEKISDFAVRVSDHIVIPLHARTLLASKVARTLELIDEKGIDKARITGVFRRDDNVGEFELAVEEEVRKKYGEIIFKGVLPDHESVREAVREYDTLRKLVHQGQIPLEYYALTKEVCKQLAHS